MAQTPSSNPVKSTCHCGGVSVIAPRVPYYVSECQCTICRRYAAAWAYYSPDEVRIEFQDGATTGKYLWGDCDHTFEFCNKCGCVCYWWPLDVNINPKMAINSRNMTPEDLKFVERRITYETVNVPIGRKELAHPEDKAIYD